MARQTTLPATHRTLTAGTGLAALVRKTLQAWAFRRKSRQSLARLGEHHLRDIGLDPLTASAECAKPFWRD